MCSDPPGWEKAKAVVRGKGTDSILTHAKTWWATFPHQQFSNGLGMWTFIKIETPLNSQPAFKACNYPGLHTT